MIRTQRALDELLPDQAYMLGYQDHADSLDREADEEATLQASRSARRLDGLLDRIYHIAPYELPPEPDIDESELPPPPHFFDQNAQ